MFRKEIEIKAENIRAENITPFGFYITDSNDEKPGVFERYITENYTQKYEFKFEGTLFKLFLTRTFDSENDKDCLCYFIEPRFKNVRYIYFSINILRKNL
jgi:hypothetical protein